MNAIWLFFGHVYAMAKLCVFYERNISSGHSTAYVVHAYIKCMVLQLWPLSKYTATRLEWPV